MNVIDAAFVAEILWPAFFIISLVLIYLLLIPRAGYSKQAAYTGALGSLIVLILIYEVSSVRNVIRIGLSIIGIALPLALGIISIRHLVEET